MMAVSAFPAVVDALVAQASAHVPAGVVVADAIPAVGDPADFLAVGIQSLATDAPPFAGRSEQEWAGVGGVSRDEEGVVNCIAAARSTDDTIKDARDRAFAIAEGVATLCRADVTLGLSTVWAVSFGTTVNAAPLYEDGQPPAYVVEFQVAYKARI